jgi:hypothetical protein
MAGEGVTTLGLGLDWVLMLQRAVATECV